MLDIWVKDWAAIRHVRGIEVRRQAGPPDVTRYDDPRSHARRPG